MIAPAPASIMAGSTALATRNVPRALTFITRSQSATGRSATVAMLITPATFARMSMRSPAARTDSTSRATESASATSTWRWPAAAAPRLAAVWLAVPASTSAAITRAPAVASS